jgi:hypothetical protein
MRQHFTKIKALRNTRQKIRRHSRLLRSGEYVWHGGEVWAHRNSEVPDHILGAKGNYGRSRPLWLRLLRPVLSIHVNAQEALGHHYDVIVRTNDPGLLFISTDRAITLRLGIDGEHLRPVVPHELWVRYVGRDLRVAANEGRTEQLVGGTTARMSSISQLEPAIKQVLIRYAGLAAATAKYSPTYVRILKQHANLSKYYHLIIPALQLVPETILQLVPIVPVHGDNSPDNVIITHQGSAVFIDLHSEPFWRPAICHPLGIISSWRSGEELTTRFVNGAFDDELQLLIPHLPTKYFSQRIRAALLVLAVALDFNAHDVPLDRAKRFDWLANYYGMEHLAGALTA